MTNSLGVTDRSITASTTADGTVARNVGRLYLFLQNLHATAIVWVRIDQTTAAGGTAVTAVAGAKGCIRLAPGASVVWENNFVPTGALSVISDTASTPVTILEG